jgi:hypothetical protein
LEDFDFDDLDDLSAWDDLGVDDIIFLRLNINFLDLLDLPDVPDLLDLLDFPCRPGFRDLALLLDLVDAELIVDLDLLVCALMLPLAVLVFFGRV